MGKLFSVITLTYNNFDHLKETILSVCAQDYGDIEYIICDDGSKDFPEEQVVKWIENHKSLNLRRYMILRQLKNVGTVQNINYAYRHATGDYYINLSCGDVFFETQTISKIASRMISRKAKMMVTSRLLYVDNFTPVGLVPHYRERKRLYQMKSRTDQLEAFLDTRLFGMASGSVLCSSRLIMEEMDFFDERYILMEDSPLLAKYLKNYELEYYPELVSIWYEQGGVSTGGFRDFSPLLQKDTALFEQNEWKDSQIPLATFEKRNKEFLEARWDAVTIMQKILCYLRHPIQAGSFLLFKIEDKIKRIEDKSIIKTAMQERIQAAVDGC